MSDLDTIRLTHLANELRRCGLVEHPPAYDRLYRGVLSGLFPAEQSDGGRWSVRRSDLPLVANALGLARGSAGTARVPEHAAA